MNINGNAGVSGAGGDAGNVSGAAAMVESMYVPQWRATGAADDL